MIFRFKKFEINQQKSAMKVGTDGVLLGAWADFSNPKSILDIGTGTGLIALMMAQRFEKAVIKAIEIDRDAAKEAQGNFECSPWRDRLSALNLDFFRWNNPATYDLIVCNPPFFKPDLHAPDQKRALARSGAATNRSFLIKAKAFMHDQSLIAFIIPAEQLGQYKKDAELAGMGVKRMVYVKPTNEKKAHRVLVTFGFGNHIPASAHAEFIVIEDGGRHRYSDKYKMLTKDFYLKF